MLMLTGLPLVAQEAAALKEAMAALRSGDWDTAAVVAGGDPILRDIVEWQRLRAGRGSPDEVLCTARLRPPWAR